jgi:hypothetical protein
MSGPIIRKYGFPNFEKIFGERPLEHGVDDAEQRENHSKAEEAAGSPSAQRLPEQSRKTESERKG